MSPFSSDSHELQETPPQVEARRLDHLPLALAFLRQMQVAHSIDLTLGLTPDPTSGVPSPGVCVEAMVLNLLQDRVALFQMEHWLRGADTAFLFGTNIDSQAFTDDRLGRTLDSLFEAGLDTLHSKITANLINLGISVRRLHSDSTSIKTFGAYELPEDESGPRALLGFSKDHRPDLKQFIFGLTVQEDGIPLVSTTLDGNAHDGVVYKGHLERLRPLLKNPEQTTYVGDSKLCDQKTLGLLRYQQFHFTTLLPRTFNLHQELLDRAVEAPRERWDELAKREEDEEPFRGRMLDCRMTLLCPAPKAEEDPLPKEEELTALVVYSPQLARTHQKAYEKELAESRRKLERALKALREVNYPSEAEAKRAARHFAKAHAAPGWKLVLTPLRDELRPKRSTRGRPKKEEQVESQVVYWLEPELLEDQEARAGVTKHHGLFVLVTSRTGAARPAAKEILGEYRGQHAAESGFRWLKGPAQVAPIFLHTPSRIEALGFVFTIALQVHTLLQWKIRKRLAEEKQTIPGHDRKPTAKPTTLVLLRLFAQITRVSMKTPNGMQVYLAGFQPIHAQVLSLLGLPLSTYHGPPQKISDPAGGPAE